MMHNVDEPLSNPRHERFAQALVAGMSQIDAYVAAGYARNEARASRLRRAEQVRTRVAGLCASSAHAVVHAIASSATTRQALIQAGYAMLGKKLGAIEVADAQAWKALADAVLALDKDQRVVDGGVSDRTTTAVTGGGAAADEMRVMLDALAKRTAEGSTGH
jgi:uncharacterized membrane protein YgcG